MQGWFLAAPGSTSATPTVVLEIPAGLPRCTAVVMWEWQVAASGISVYAATRGLEGSPRVPQRQLRGLGRRADARRHGGVDALARTGSPIRIVSADRRPRTCYRLVDRGHTDRFKAAGACRSVTTWSARFSGRHRCAYLRPVRVRRPSVDDWDLYRRNSPLTYAENVTTPSDPARGQDCAADQPLRGALRVCAAEANRAADAGGATSRTSDPSGTPFRRVETAPHREWFRTSWWKVRRACRGRPEARLTRDTGIDSSP